MPDSFTETTTTGYGGRIVSSIKGVLIGIIMVLVSFGLLYWNEGRVDLSKVAKTATDIPSATASSDATLSGKLVSTTGMVNSNETIGDNLFLKPDKFISVERRVEMYAWKEQTSSRSRSNTGGSKTTETTYSYSETWTETPASSSSFKHPEGHENPQKSLASETNTATAATIGVYSLDPKSVTLPDSKILPLTAQNTTLSGGTVLANDSFLFIKKSAAGTFDSPQIGDLRVSYYVLSPGFSGTVFGQLNGSKIDPYTDRNGTDLYRLFAGTRDQSLSTLSTEHTTLLWILRAVGFALMWFGMMALFQPIIVLLDVLPILGSISSCLTGLITFIVALVLSTITILISMIVHNLIALIITLIITVAVIIAIVKILRRRTATPTATPPAATQ